jgi:hypothetical protein
MKEEKMRTKFAVALAIAAVCVTTAMADWTSDSLVTGSDSVWIYFYGNWTHKLVYGTDGVGHLVWHGNPSGQPYCQVWYNRYNPGSGNKPGYWTANYCVTPPGKKEKAMRAAPSVALDSDGRTFHVVWNRSAWGTSPEPPESICYVKCTQDRKGNDKWGTVVPLHAAKYATWPTVACVPSEANHVVVCWSDGVVSGTGVLSHVIRFREYVNGTWQPVVRLDSSLDRDYPAIAAAANGEVFVAYSGTEDGGSDQQVFVKTRTNGVWGERVNVTGDFPGHGGGPAIEVNPATGHPHLVFPWVTEVTNGGEPDTFCALYHTFRTASGNWLTTPEAVSEPRPWGPRPVPLSPSMGFDGNGVAYVAWIDSAPSASFGIMYGYCLDEGGTWSTPEWLTSYLPYGGPYVAVEEPAHIVHVAWGSTRPGKTDCREIWWKSNLLGSGGGGQAQPVALSQSGIELIPNPAKAGRVTVQYTLPRAGQMTVTLLDVSGRAVWTQEVAASDRGSAAIDVSGLNAGVYVVKLESGSASQIRKLVIQ